MRKRKEVVVYGACEDQVALLRFVLNNTMRFTAIGVTSLEEMARAVLESQNLGCIILLRNRDEEPAQHIAAVCKALCHYRLQETPFIEVMNGVDDQLPMSARVLGKEMSMAVLLEAVRLLGLRKRGPKTMTHFEYLNRQMERKVFPERKAA